MDLIAFAQWFFIEVFQPLLILALFVGILAVSFKIWRWNYVIPPR